jgi:hypothetical protein
MEPNGIQEVARSIRVSSTNKIKHYLVLGQHRTAALPENCPNLSSSAFRLFVITAGFRLLALRETLLVRDARSLKVDT